MQLIKAHISRGRTLHLEQKEEKWSETRGAPVFCLDAPKTFISPSSLAIFVRGYDRSVQPLLALQVPCVLGLAGASWSIVDCAVCLAIATCRTLQQPRHTPPQVRHLGITTRIKAPVITRPPLNQKMKQESPTAPASVV